MPLNSQGTTAGVRFMMCALNPRDPFLLRTFQYQYQRLGLHPSGIQVTHAKLRKSDNLSLSIRGVLLDLPAGHCLIYEAVRTIPKQCLQGAGWGWASEREGKWTVSCPSLSFLHGPPACRGLSGGLAPEHFGQILVEASESCKRVKVTPRCSAPCTALLHSPGQ